MQSVTNNQSGNISAVATLVGNVKMFVGAAIAASILLISVNQAGAVHAQPVSDPLGVFKSSMVDIWSGISEEAQWSLSVPNTVTTNGFSSIYEEMAEENTQAVYAPTTVTTNGFSDIYQLMAEENES